MPGIYIWLGGMGEKKGFYYSVLTDTHSSGGKGQLVVGDLVDGLIMGQLDIRRSWTLDGCARGLGRRGSGRFGLVLVGSLEEGHFFSLWENAGIGGFVVEDLEVLLDLLWLFDDCEEKRRESVSLPPFISLQEMFKTKGRLLRVVRKTNCYNWSVSVLIRWWTIVVSNESQTKSVPRYFLPQ